MNSLLDSPDSNVVSSMFGNSTISPKSSSGSESSFEDEDDDDSDVVVFLVEFASSTTIAAASAAAACMSRGANEAGRGSESARVGKLRTAEFALLMARAATSWARAAISGVANVPSQILDFFRGSRISDTHFPQLRIRTPR
ncbi:hypothetical protein PanWU01x14_195460 [Parasponia andersonii]|uniref:Uncharacterized protein n=1 Tax=Parasponia andersonii TaxID=3476 RepID=A0A2P5BZT7_PARAD|nr:hypothetical protein PanWU01x14_195460 [Parasponia andersonii]